MRTIRARQGESGRLRRFSPDRRRVLALAATTGALCALRAPVAAAAAPVRTGRTSTPAVQTARRADLTVLAQGFRSPEGPTVLPSGSVAFTTLAGDIMTVSPSGQLGTLVSSLPGVIGTVLGPHRENALYIAKYDADHANLIEGRDSGVGRAPKEGAILRLDLHSRALGTLYTQWDEQPLQGPNDLLIDGFGDLWFTDYFVPALFWARTDGSAIRRMVYPLPDANGIALSPDRRSLYLVSESKLVVYTITARGQLAQDAETTQVRTLATLPDKWRVDGIKTEAGGNIVLACWDEGLVVISPQGETLSQTRLPGLGVSNFVFGGPRMRTLYMTTTVDGTGANGQPQGRVVAMAWPRPGLKPI
jgi:gluconolactonase